MSRVVRLRTEEGAFVAVLGSKGRKFTSYVSIMGFPVRKRRLKNADVERYCTDLQYPLKKAVSRIRGVGRRQGITKGARQLLNDALA